MPRAICGWPCGAAALCTVTPPTARSTGSSGFQRPIRRPARSAAPASPISTSRRPPSSSRSASARHNRAPARCSVAGPGSAAARRIASRDSMPAIEFRSIEKSFGAVAALRDVSFTVDAGEAHAYVGENGAGKSTLLNILAGSLKPDRGEICVDGRPVALASPRDALARSIGLVHQEMLAFPNLSVTANIFAGRELTGRFGRLREAEMRRRPRDVVPRPYHTAAP